MVDEMNMTGKLAVQIDVITAPGAAAASVATAQPARAGTGSERKRLSKGQRKHLRRQKQAGEIKVTPRR